MKNIVFFFALISFSAFSQKKFDFYNYWSYTTQAQMANFKKEYKIEKQMYEKSFEYGGQDFPSYTELFFYSICLLNNNDTAKAAKYIKKAILKGVIFIPRDSLTKVFGKKYGPQIFQQFPELEQKYLNTFSKIDLEKRDLETFDQSVRKYLTLRENFPDMIGNRILEITDSVNFFMLYQLVKNKGTNPQSILMWHIYGENKKYFAFYDSILKSNLFSGKLDPHEYVQWHDRQRMYVDNMQTQLYGEWNDGGRSGVYFSPIEDIKNVDKRRFALGLCSLQDYAILNSMELPKDYNPPKNNK